MVLHVGDPASSSVAVVHVPPSCGGVESLLARCWEAHQSSQQATQAACDVDLTEHAHAMHGARVGVSVCKGGGGCTAARVLLLP